MTKSKSAIIRNQAEIKKTLPQYCDVTGVSTGVLDLSHLVPQSRSRQLQDHPDNVRIHCRKVHNIWEHDKRNFMKYWPHKWRQYMRRIMALDAEYGRLLKEKYQNQKP